MSGPVRSSPNRRGFTLLELLLAVAITAVLGLTVTTVLTAASRGMTSTRANQSALQRAHALQARLRAYTDPALCLLDYEPGQAIALWLEDPDDDQRVRLSEVRVFWIDPANGVVTVERTSFPAEWDADTLADHDIVLTPASDFFTEFQTLRTLGYTTTETLADGVAGATLTWDGVTLREQARAVMRVSLQVQEEHTEDLIACIGMPNYTEPK